MESTTTTTKPQPRRKSSSVHVARKPSIAHNVAANPSSSSQAQQQQQQSPSSFSSQYDDGDAKSLTAALVAHNNNNANNNIKRRRSTVAPNAASLVVDSDSNITNEEVEEFRELFMLVDRDGTGCINEKELKQLLDTIRVYPKQEEVHMIFQEIDKTGDGDIQFDEFVDFMSKGIITSFTKEKLVESFESFRRPDDPPGKILHRELKRAFLNHIADKFVDENEVDDLLRHVHLDDKGYFDYAQYIATMLK